MGSSKSKEKEKSKSKSSAVAKVIEKKKSSAKPSVSSAKHEKPKVAAVVKASSKKKAASSSSSSELSEKEEKEMFKRVEKKPVVYNPEHSETEEDGAPVLSPSSNEQEMCMDIGGMKRVSVSKFKDAWRIDLRHYFFNEGGMLKPTKKGINFSLDEWQTLVDHAPAIHKFLVARGAIKVTKGKRSKK
jgi:hypothetical protein